MNFECLATDSLELKSFIENLPNCKLKTKCEKAKGDKFVRKYFTSEKIDDHNIKKGVVLNYITKETLDRDGEVIKLDGIRIDNFLGAVYWNHDYGRLPVAKNLWARNDGFGLLGATMFLDKTEHQRSVKSMYTEDIEGTGPVLKSFSMGFIPVKYHYADEMDKKAYGDNTKLIYDEIEMFEYSAVGIPANRDALTVAVGKGFSFEDQKLPESVIKIISETKSFSHNSKISDNEPKWGGVDKAELPWKSFVFESESFDKNKKSTWKFPHHWVENGGGKDDNGVLTTGTLLLHKGGLNVAYSAAKGARSGDTAEQAVLDHLQAHRKALGIDIENKEEVKKSIDIDGVTISVDDIKDAILLALNPPSMDVQDNRMYWSIDELFPSNYPDGHVIVEGYNLSTFIESPRKWRYEYRIEGKKAILFTPVEVEEKLQVVSGVMPTDTGKSVGKAGRVLSKKNRDLCHKAKKALEDVLGADEMKTIKIIDSKDIDVDNRKDIDVDNSKDIDVDKKMFTNKDFERIISEVSKTTKDIVSTSFKDFKNIRKELDDVANVAIRKALGKVS